MTDQQIHEAILNVVNSRNEWIYEILNEDVEKTYNVFEMESEFIKRTGLPDEAIEYDTHSGRGLVRINVEWTFHHLWQEGSIKKVGPNTYQSLKGSKAPYTGNRTSGVIRRYTSTRNEILASVKILRNMKDMNDEKMFLMLRESPTWKDIPDIIIRQSMALDKKIISDRIST